VNDVQVERGRCLTVRFFARYIGIDYSGAETSTSSLPGLRLYVAGINDAPKEINPPPSPRKYWTRRGLAEWLVAELRSDVPTDGDNTYVDFIRDGLFGFGALRAGNSRWRRLTEERCKAKSVFHFDVQGSVAKSTHSGLPWLRFIRQQLGTSVHFWPFDGWTPPPERSVIAEVYPALWSRVFASEDRNQHQHDAFAAALWMQQADTAGTLGNNFEPKLQPDVRKIAEIEGWILGLA
jgi:hypothetical protein